MQDHAAQVRHSSIVAKKTSIIQDHAAEARGTEAWSGIKTFANAPVPSEFTANFPSSMLGSFVKKKKDFTTNFPSSMLGSFVKKS
jgi:hypothetical protein